MAVANDFFLANRESERAVHTQSGHRGTTRRGEAKQKNAIPAEMTPPYFTARVEQRQRFSGFWVRCLLARPFAQRTRDAGQREVFQRCRAPGSDRNNMVHVE